MLVFTGVVRSLARIFLAAALLLAGQAALVHPLEHVDDHGALVHSGEQHERTGGELCDALQALTACVPDAPRRLAVPEVFDVPAVPVERAPRVAEAPPFLSQGPPQLL